MPTCKENTYYIENKRAGADTKLGALLFHILTSFEKDFQDLVILCIGSDRITGDSLGPLVGHSLSKAPLKSTWVYGTLNHPVHALNLSETVNMVRQRHPESLVLAIDASLGSRRHLGCLTITRGSLEPGLGVRKKLQPVGDISITGIVNTSGTFDHFSLQTTRLATVVGMADSIVSGILLAHRQYFGLPFLPRLPFFQPEPERTRSFTKSVPFSEAAFSSPKGRI